jgi:hypothetical protein
VDVKIVFVLDVVTAELSEAAHIVSH